MVVFDRLLSCSRGLSDVLQSTQLDLAKAADLVSALIETFEDFRSDESWKKVFEYAVCHSIVRFDSKNLQIINSVQACSPQSTSFLQSDDLSGLTEAYGIDADAVAVEAPLARAALRGKEMESIGDVLRELAPLKVAFPCLIKVVHIALTLAITSATCECSFSALKRIKNYRRSTMTEPRLNDLAVLSIERDLSRTLDLDAVVQKFAFTDKKHRIAMY